MLGPAHAAAAAHVPPVQMPPQQPQMQPQLPQMQLQSIAGPPTDGLPHYMPDSYQAGPSHQPVYTNSDQMYQSVTPAVPQPTVLRSSRGPCCHRHSATANSSSQTIAAAPTTVQYRRPHTAASVLVTGIHPSEIAATTMTGGLKVT
jgi:hypothetical protein